MKLEDEIRYSVWGQGCRKAYGYVSESDAKSIAKKLEGMTDEPHYTSAYLVGAEHMDEGLEEDMSKHKSKWYPVGGALARNSYVPRVYVEPEIKVPTARPTKAAHLLADRIKAHAYLFKNDLDALPGEHFGTTRYDRYNFVDNGADILVVAHTDSVVEQPKLRVDAKVIACPVLDNRIGVYIALAELPNMGIVTDVLLTQGEESCMSTAQHFVLPEGKNYKWIAEFDRMGFDCALYQYDDDETRAAVTKAGYTPVWGSYTDVCELDHLGVKAFNFGVAYRDYHSKNAHIYTDELSTLLFMFRDFYEMFRDTTFPHTYVKPTYTGYTHQSQYYTKGYGDNWEWYDTKYKANGVVPTTAIQPVDENGEFLSQCGMCDGYFVPDTMQWNEFYGDVLCPACHTLAKEEAVDYEDYKRGRTFGDKPHSKYVTPDAFVKCDVCDGTWNEEDMIPGMWYKTHAHVCPDCVKYFDRRGGDTFVPDETHNEPVSLSRLLDSGAITKGLM